MMFTKCRSWKIGGTNHISEVMKMIKEDYIENIYRKLANGIQLDGLEIRTVIAALRESEHCYQKPYYEVVYHDECGNQEKRIMNPVSQTSRPFDQDGYYMLEDRFEVNFRRIVRNNE